MKTLLLIVVALAISACSVKKAEIERHFPLQPTKLLIYQNGAIIREIPMTGNTAFDTCMRKMTDNWETTIVNFAPKKYWVHGPNFSVKVWPDRLIGYFWSGANNESVGGVRPISVAEYSEILKVLQECDK